MAKKNYTPEELDYMKELIDEAVSDYANGHWTSDDFDNNYERRSYLRDLANGDGDLDYEADCIIEELPEEVDLEVEEIDNYLTTAIMAEADYWAD